MATKTKAKKTAPKSAKSAKKAVTKKSTARRKSAARNSGARVKTQHREGTIRAKLEAIYKAKGYEAGKKEAIKKGFNKFTVQKQMYLIHTGQ